MTEDLSAYQPAIEHVARSAAPVANRLDSQARDRDDYRQELAYVALQARDAYRRSRGYCSPQERLYVLRSLWNHIRSALRARARALGERRTREGIGDWAALELVDQPEARYEAREALRVVGAALEKHELELVDRLAQAGGHVPRAHQPDRDGSISTFRRQVRAVRERVRSLV